MKNQKSRYIILPLIALILMSCQFARIEIDNKMLDGSGVLESETREVSNIKSVTVEDRGSLTILQGDAEGLSIEADDNLLQYIRAEMRGSELRIEIADGYSVSDDSTIRYTLRVKDLNRIALVGAGEVAAEGLKTENLTLHISGSGNMKISGLEAKRLTVEADGSGNFRLEGEVDDQSLTINGAGNYEAGDLKSREARVTISGAGNATVWAEEKLDIRVSGFGNVGYYGSPQISETMAGGGAVNDLGPHK